jgi:hypothetical protein
MKTAHEIIDETVEYYSKNPRSLGKYGSKDSACLYLGPNGEKCAFSRCVMDSEVKGLHQSEGQSLNMFVRNDSLDHVLESEYRGHSKDFWISLQHLHDDKSHWNGNTLTVEGQNFVKRLKKHFV